MICASMPASITTMWPHFPPIWHSSRSASRTASCGRQCWRTWPMRRDCALAKRHMLSCGWILPKAWAPAVTCAGISQWQRFRDLIAFFHHIASEGTPEEALAAFYAYESQIPRLAGEKARGLHDMYAVDEKACRYFALHTTADIYHAQVWRQQLEKRVESNPGATEKALDAAEAAAGALWRALDGIEAMRLTPTA